MTETTNGGVVPQTVPASPEVAQQVAPAPVYVPQQTQYQQPAAPQELPQDTRNSTREQFEKLLESNKRLHETTESLRKELEQRNKANEIFKPIQAQVPQPSQPSTPAQIDPADFVETDPITGEQYLNKQKLNARLAEIQQRATRAEQAVQSYIKTSEEREIDRQNKEAFQAHPDLNPQGQGFNASLNRQVRGILLDSMYSPEDYGGRPLSFKEAADFVKAQYPQTQPTSVTADAAATKKAADASRDLKEQGSAQVQSQPQNAPTPTYDEDIARLRMATRRGDTEALAKRLLSTQHILSKDAQIVS